MKVFLFIIIIVIFAAVAGSRYRNSGTINTSLISPSITPSISIIDEDIPLYEVIAENLNTPWSIAFLPDEKMLVTERPGRVRFIENGKLDQNPIAVISEVKEIGEGGLMGIALHPDFLINNHVYFYYTYEGQDGTLNRVVRMTYKNKTLTDSVTIIDSIPGASNHNGGRIKFGPDKFMYIATGDAENPSQAQDKNSLAGKILRVTDKGSPISGNPFGNRIYSFGHRNVQGLAWDEEGNLWVTEHGRSGISSGLDEINLIESGKNYGWPVIQGDQTRDGMERAIQNSGSTTWAPAGAVYVGKSIFFGGLRGEALYEAVVENRRVYEVKEHFKGQFGRIREVILGPDGFLYISTSNKDGRGDVRGGDDKIIKVNPNKL
ncbi:MAG: Quinoprotein glucose dehydrogenase [Candidatus Gottesmanbacteria bacterium GW2011_GWC2_39_8]|uniref:Quinoprotein glucose dehydrogenase n=1 Tax=Candidatus Gottesmanbacteria bacterium GW2011_GWC2_39_8 TaxID=1618450 RepID=A0A0G0PZ00_9BACT|nr:MAG: Quinoprotein glucose dehydrogenase [Candidatus Gottesmanbacteria bacterium GW2011_GWC2_39_8]